MYKYKKYGLGFSIKPEQWEAKSRCLRTWKERLFSRPWNPFKKWEDGPSLEEIFNSLQDVAKMLRKGAEDG